MSDPVFVCFTRSVIESGNLMPFLDRYGPDRLPQGYELHAMMGTLSFFVDGYNEDPDEIYSIPAVRSFFAKLHREWPFLLYFADLRNESLQIVTTCLLKNLTSQKILGSPVTRLEIDPMELAIFVYNGFSPMNHICELAGCTEREIFERTEAVFRYFDLPFDQTFREQGD